MVVAVISTRQKSGASLHGGRFDKARYIVIHYVDSSAKSLPVGVWRNKARVMSRMIEGNMSSGG